VSIAVPVGDGLPSDLAAEADLPPVPAQFLKRFAVEEYHELIDKGAFADDEAFELLEGWVVHKMGKNRPHSLVTQRLRDMVAELLDGYYADAQEPITTSDSEPEPDLSVVRGCREDYTKQPLAKDAPLVAEVSERSLARDRTLKKRIYARAKIPVFWIVNLIERQIEIYTEPSGPSKRPDYKECQIVKAEGTLPVVIDGKEVGKLKVKDLLP